MAEPMISPTATDDTPPLSVSEQVPPSPPAPPLSVLSNEEKHEEEKQEEDEELALATSVRSTNTHSTQRSIGVSGSSESHHPSRNNGSITDLSATEIYYGTDMSTNGSETGKHLSSKRPSNINTGFPPQDSTPVKKNTRPKNNDEEDGVMVSSKDEDDDEEDDIDDDASYDTVAVNKRRAQDRRFGCIMFQSGFVGVIIAIILLTIQVVKENNEPVHTVVVDTNQEEAKRTKSIMKILELPPQTTALIEQDPQSPQAMAVEWLIDDPWWDTYTYSQARARQRLCLASLYFATQGSEWILTSSDMLSYNTHECEWLPTENLVCNDDYQFTLLNLENVGLKGTVPDEVFGIMAPRTLEHVALGRNEIGGTLSSEVGLLTNLNYLDISQTLISESIPSEIGNCRSLKILYLQSNALLEGTLPTQVGQLSALQGLWWRNTATGGSIPSELGSLVYLEVLELSGNKLTGEIPSELVSDADLPSSIARSAKQPESTKTSVGLQDVRLAGNRLTGFIPPITGRARTSLKALVLSGNAFDSTVLPSHLANLAKLTSLQVGDCAWTGLIPSELGLMSAHLESLGLNGNSFSGTVPTELLQLSQLQNLYLHDILGLDGRIVDASEGSTEGDLALGRLSNLKELTINDTPLSGVLPDSLCVISILSFTCDPDSLCGCDCECSTNSPTARITTRPTEQPTTQPTMRPSPSPSEMPTSAPPTNVPTAPISSIREAFVDNLPNYTLVGLEYPQSPQTYALNWLFSDPNVRVYSPFQRRQRFAMATLFVSLYGIEASANETAWLSYDTHECFWAGIGKSYASCEAFEGDDRLVVGLYLAPTGMQGILPPEVALMSALASIQGSSGIMSGPLPTELGLLTGLHTLRLPEHNILGSIPSELGRCSSLRTVDLALNNLSSSLPTELALLPKLESFAVPQNSLVGNLPANWPHSLKHMDLSHNGFSGTIPMPFWALSLRNSLQTLEIGDNNLVGRVDLNVGHLGHLTRLDLSGNQLTGPLPSEVGSLTRLTTLDASRNGFVETIPTTIGQLSQLKFLYLNSNNIRGSIPAQIGMLSQLEVLRLHDNDRIDGRIPQSIVDLPLSVLTVNETSVAGRIPSGLCFLDVFAFSCSSSLCGCRNCACPPLT
ncbi:Leucine Rich Repeat [Seminavis robusta]|uniref:non-specific serine/threonine protein kinase n=1 Tax=Seminavis robusta TaxID=568900 RepID=A0A9N8EQS6_9STRA|nr:Leucine Rich Repeat [Seminavis robusta]|eukprot:Sro1457_g274360.1 Leucine Rich Repeat (1127) ;mRNA; f:21016-24396